MHLIVVEDVFLGVIHMHFSAHSYHPLQLDDAKTDDIENLLDQPASMFIINQSRWSMLNQ